MKPYSLICLLFCAVCVVAAEPADTSKPKQDREYRWERFSYSIGGFLLASDSELRLASKNLGVGVSVNFEDLLGLESVSTVIRSEAEYSFGKKLRSNVRIGYYGFFRSSYKKLQRDIEIGDQIFEVGTELNSTLNIQILRGIYDYAFYKDERVSLAASVGLYTMPISFALRADDNVDQAASFVAPLPVVGIRNYVLITPKVKIKQSIEVLYFQYAGIVGKINDLNIFVEYMPHRNVGVGLGYNSFLFDFEVETEGGDYGGFSGRLRSDISGLMLYGKVAF